LLPAIDWLAMLHIPYCRHFPHTRQQEFLALTCREAFFGGAAGGGKSDALLMGALMYAATPGYAALILRKDVQRLALAGGLIPRSHEWFAGSDAIWNGQRRQWTFPTGEGPPATLTFGYISGPFDKYRYASSEYHYIAFDELTEFREEDYLYLFSRLRRVSTLGLPLRVRSASNPGNLGHLWVKQRFIEGAIPVGWDQPAASAGPPKLLRKDDRLFMPSRIADNPSLDAEEYRQSLLHLPPIDRERLLHGDWNVQEQGIFRAGWLRYFVEAPSFNPQPKAQADGPSTPQSPAPALRFGYGLNDSGATQLELLDTTDRILTVVPEQSCRRFVTIDPAGTSADKQRESRGRSPSWTVVQVWDQPPRELSRFLMLREQVRERVAFDGLVAIVRTVHARWLPQRIWIEDEKLGHAAVSILQREGLPIETIRTSGRDKLTRASELILKMERGEIFLPRLDNRWRAAFEAELLAWTGHEHQPSDQIDAAAYAAIIASTTPTGPVRIQPVVHRS
jgi:predicted phage terminase large subunit-like protein